MNKGVECKMFKKFKEEILKDPRAIKFGFKPDGRNHYIYRISKDGEHYYGSRTSEIDPKDDLGFKYFTSSTNELFKEDFTRNSSNYKIKIIKIFDNKDDKYIYESFIHRKFNVSHNAKFINRYNHSPFTYDTTGLVTVKNKLDETFQICDNDPRYLSGELKGVTAGLVAAINSMGEKVMIDKIIFDKDPTLVGVTKGMVSCKNKKTDQKLYIRKDIFEKDDDLVGITFGTTFTQNISFNKRTRSKESCQKQSNSIKGKSTGPFTQERKDNISKAALGRKWYKNPQGTLSVHVSNIVAPCYTLFGWVPGRAHMKNLPKKECPHCGKQYNPGNMTQHLNKYCKILYPKSRQ